MKTCAGCKLSKNQEEFGVCSRLKDGKNNYCKECMKVFSKATYEKRKYKKLEQAKI